MRIPMWIGLALMCLALGLMTQATGQTPQPKVKVTVITIDDLDCAECAKGVRKAVAEVPGVDDVSTDIEKQIATVVPKTDKGPSAKALWEAIEKAGFKPLKLEGPSGTFTKKPDA